MKIEITDLPNGKAIKHINIDITFDDNSEIKSKNIIVSNTTSDSKESKIPEEMINNQF